MHDPVVLGKSEEDDDAVGPELGVLFKLRRGIGVDHERVGTARLDHERGQARRAEVMFDDGQHGVDLGGLVQAVRFVLRPFKLWEHAEGRVQDRLAKNYVESLRRHC